MSLDTDVAQFRELYASSVVATPEFGRNEITTRWGEHPDFAKLIRAVIVRNRRTGKPVPHLPSIRQQLRLEEGIGLPSADIGKTANAIFHVTGWVLLAPLDDPSWREAIDLGRAYVASGLQEIATWWETATCESARRLIQMGYALHVRDGAYEFDEGHIEKATASVQAILDSIGILGSLDLIFERMLQTEATGYGMILFTRRSTHQPREPVVPYGFLINLALRSPERRLPRSIAVEEFRRACDLSRDLVAVLGVETFFQPAGVRPPPVRLESTLRRAAQFDHLLGFRQWPPEQTELLLKSFFDGMETAEVETEIGWKISDAIALWNVMRSAIQIPHPAVLPIEVLRQCGVPADRFDALLKALSHPQSGVNAGYVSPLAAGGELGAGRMAFMRPFVALENGRYLIITPSAAGYGFYEAIMDAFRSRRPKSTAKWVGDGTERVVIALLRAASFPPPLINEKYDLKSPSESGECDVVVETPKHILIFECKAKPLTRGAMAGTSTDALLDFAGGVFDAQAQGLRHERILRARGNIEFRSKRRLELKGRKIIRVCVTLLDLGALQDALMIWGITPTIKYVLVEPVVGYKKATQVAALNDSIRTVADESGRLETMGIDSNDQDLRTRSFSAGQLAVILRESAGADDFIRRIQTNLSYGTLNPLLEYRLRSEMEARAAKQQNAVPSGVIEVRNEPTGKG